MLLRYDYIVTSSLSDKTDLISNFRIEDLPGITDTEKYRFYFNIPQRMFIVVTTAVTASLPLQKDKVGNNSERALLCYVYIVTSLLSDKTD